ncbi:MAG: R3H domain-containing nucleic acid-binding protein [Candidatus Gracilibacteria bacterium]|nr:R3H domain-containing nucleic acid-binding protein [Candidatus Gracilibacteria bacterium]
MNRNKIFQTYEDRLFLRIDRSIVSLKNNGGEYDLGKLTPYDRKRIHSYIAKKHIDIISKSRGKGEDRKIYLLLKNNKIQKNIKPEIRTRSKLTIDINGDSI